HDPALRSWVDSANERDADFPIQNLPFGVFSDVEPPRVGVAIGDRILDVGGAVEAGLLTPSQAATACSASSLNALMGMSPEHLAGLRREISGMLADGGGVAAKAQSMEANLLVKMSDAVMHLPAAIGDYTDFYASINHATNVGRMFRPDNPLLPNYKYIPIGYHGRASSVVVSGHPVARPRGQTKVADAAAPSWGESTMLDYESELGFYIGMGNRLGETIPIDDSANHIFGFSLVNDWSARDLQSWEYQPLGPFLAKSFATTVSPWVVTSAAAAPYRVAAAARPPGDPSPLVYRASAEDQQLGGLNAVLEVFIATPLMRSEGAEPARLSCTPFTGMYWTVAQMLAHHSSNGCNLRPGDLLASGTVSGEAADQRGCLLELTSRGANPVQLPTGEERRFLENGDEIIMTGYLKAPGRPRIGFGECRGTIQPEN
ncbi:MAG: fumarylacetoacetase, partial [Gemmatimonadaceae bacterium]